MASSRRTVSLPEDLALEIEREARKQGRSFSATLAELARRSLYSGSDQGLSWIGAGESGDPYFAEKSEQYLAEIAKGLDS